MKIIKAIGIFLYELWIACLIVALAYFVAILLMVVINKAKAAEMPTIPAEYAEVITGVFGDEYNIDIYAPLGYSYHFNRERLADGREKNEKHKLYGIEVNGNGYQVGVINYENTYYKQSTVVYGGKNFSGYNGAYVDLSYGANFGAASNYSEAKYNYKGFVPYFSIFTTVTAFDNVGMRFEVADFKVFTFTTYARF